MYRSNACSAGGGGERGLCVRRYAPNDRSPCEQRILLLVTRSCAVMRVECIYASAGWAARVSFDDDDDDAATKTSFAFNANGYIYIHICCIFHNKTGIPTY